MNVKRIDERFATSGQLRVEDVQLLAERGYATIVCARPDNEDAGQPAFEAIAREAARHGLAAIHIPVRGLPTPQQIESMGKAVAQSAGPVLGYCRSGGRSANLYAAARRGA